MPASAASVAREGPVADDRIRGVIIPIVTPLTPDYEVDTSSLRRLVAYMIDNGVHGIWTAGTTGEFASLTDAQRALVTETIVDEVNGRVPIIANVSGAGTEAAVKLAADVRELPLDGIAATPPYYYPCAQDELLDHYRHIHDRVGLPLWVYNIPVTVKTVVEPATMATLASEGAVVGVKDSSGAGELLAQLVALGEQGGFEMYRFLGTDIPHRHSRCGWRPRRDSRDRQLRPRHRGQPVGSGRGRRPGGGHPPDGLAHVRHEGYPPRRGRRAKRGHLLGNQVGPQGHGRHRPRHGHAPPPPAHR